MSGFSGVDRRNVMTGMAAMLAISSPLRAQRRGGKAIIIGAGAAGLSCARHIKQAGMDVVVLEAQDRIGGRLKTSHTWQDMPVELGASWIHGLQGNPAVELVQASGLNLLPTDYDNTQVYSEFEGILEGGALNRLEEMERRLLRFAENAPGGNLESDCRSRPRGSLKKRLVRLMRLESPSVSKRRRGLFLLNTEVEHEFGADFEELSRCFWAEGNDQYGGDAIVTGGLDRLMMNLAEGLDIRLSQAVQRIEHSQTGVIVSTQSGSESADVVVVTIPLGVLQGGGVEFSPALPSSKDTAIQSLGSGLLNKCILRFDESAWPEAPEIFNRVADERGAWTEFLNLSSYGQGPALMAFNAGSYARYLEQYTDEETVAEAVHALRGMFGANFPDPISAQVTRWAQDPNALGSYSYPSEDTRWDTRIRLLEPVDQRLFFAGEATSTHAPGTLHGAILSGRAAANAVVER